MSQRSLGLFVIIALAAGVGALAGLGSFTFIYAKGYSYLTNDPGACANCHVMRDYYESWLKSSHHTVATCNDCHTPKGLVGKYAVKGLNGFNHALAFTTGNYQEPLQATSLNKRVAQNSCLKCHAALVHPLAWGATNVGGALPACTQCHQAVGHPMR
jgi:cytochrome c nitrite reductase small subunit